MADGAEFSNLVFIGVDSDKYKMKLNPLFLRKRIEDAGKIWHAFILMITHLIIQTTQLFLEKIEE